MVERLRAAVAALERGEVKKRTSVPCSCSIRTYVVQKEPEAVGSRNYISTVSFSAQIFFRVQSPFDVVAAFRSSGRHCDRWAGPQALYCTNTMVSVHSLRVRSLPVSVRLSL